jgi:hypothetical protein
MGRWYMNDVIPNQVKHANHQTQWVKTFALSTQTNSDSNRWFGEMTCVTPILDVRSSRHGRILISQFEARERFLFTCAISGTRGSSGFGSVRREQIDKRTYTDRV